ncbi:hypothetical protein [Melghirimyces algeriensis]|uniref:Spore germination protein N-terminal domain-containing protein n=1 Tax=Melghirimyces algeriensis TaxID=910412 RepID=A0A521AIT4_9BACL|nr:hypothetical protein [Melghirimyces algeriensis]SMO34693.1 hypothetical protein SAMN06264849_101162 [Melghirimyces algeriensis]
MQLEQERDVFPFLDVLFRDPQNETNARVVAVDGPVRDIMYADTKDKGRLAVVIREILDLSNRKGREGLF